VDDALTIDEVREVVEAVASKLEKVYGEPMPSFDHHDTGKLSGSLAAPFQSAFGEDIYPTIYMKAAALFYFVAKDHPFENGNKRTVVVLPAPLGPSKASMAPRSTVKLIPRRT